MCAENQAVITDGVQTPAPGRGIGKIGLGGVREKEGDSRERD